MALLKACAGIACAPQTQILDLRDKQLTVVPDYIYRHRRTLEYLHLDNNQIKEITAQFCQQLTNLNTLTINENDILTLPPQISQLTRLTQIEVNKNSLQEVPDAIRFCHHLRIVDFSCNPIVYPPHGLFRITAMSKLSLTDTGLDIIPDEIGNLVNLKVFEARDNLLNTLPQTIGNLTKLVQLDLGTNEIEILPPEIGKLTLLEELWLDSNMLINLPNEVSFLRSLQCLDVSKNRLESIPEDFNLLQNLTDLHLSDNLITHIPPGVGHMRNLTLLKVDSNRIRELPETIEDLKKLRELVISENQMESLPNILFQLPNLEVLYSDQNKLCSVPSLMATNSSLIILTLRYNELNSLPEEISLLTNLRVLDLRNNNLEVLPASIADLKLKALWLGDTQVKPIIDLESKLDQPTPSLTNLYLPQKKNAPFLDEDLGDNSLKGEFNTVTFDEEVVEPKSTFGRTGTPRYQQKKQLTQSAQQAVERVQGRKEIEGKTTIQDRKVQFNTQVKSRIFHKSKDNSKKRGFSFRRLFGINKKRKYEISFITDLRDENYLNELPNDQDLNSDTKQSTFLQPDISEDPPDIITSHQPQIQKIVTIKRDPKLGLGFTFTNVRDKFDGIFVKRLLPNSPAVNLLKEGDCILEVNSQSVRAMAHEDVRDLLRSSLGDVTIKVERRQTNIDLYGKTNSQLEDSIVNDFESDSEYPIEDALIIKSGKLGMSIVGGGNISSDPFGQGRPGIYISKIVPDGAAYRAGNLKVGDKILNVNGVDLRFAPHGTAVECFTRSGQEIAVKVRHVPPPKNIQEVVINKGEDDSYGMIIRDEVDSIPVTNQPGSTPDLNSRGIFISDIQAETPAALCGKLRIGMRILEVNSKSLVGLRYKEAIGILSACTTKMNLIVCDGDTDTDNNNNNNNNNNNDSVSFTNVIPRNEDIGTTSKMDNENSVDSTIPDNQTIELNLTTFNNVNREGGIENSSQPLSMPFVISSLQCTNENYDPKEFEEITPVCDIAIITSTNNVNNNNNNNIGNNNSNNNDLSNDNSSLLAIDSTSNDVLAENYEYIVSIAPTLDTLAVSLEAGSKGTSNQPTPPCSIDSPSVGVKNTTNLSPYDETCMEELLSTLAQLQSTLNENLEQMDQENNTEFDNISSISS